MASQLVTLRPCSCVASGLHVGTFVALTPTHPLHYRLLQLPKPDVDELGRPVWGCTDSDVSKAYRRLSVYVHPDKVRGWIEAPGSPSLPQRAIPALPRRRRARMHAHACSGQACSRDNGKGELRHGGALSTLRSCKLYCQRASTFTQVAGDAARKAFEQLNQAYRELRDPGKLVGSSWGKLAGS